MDFTTFEQLITAKFISLPTHFFFMALAGFIKVSHSFDRLSDDFCNVTFFLKCATFSISRSK